MEPITWRPRSGPSPCASEGVGGRTSPDAALVQHVVVHQAGGVDHLRDLRESPLVCRQVTAPRATPGSVPLCAATAITHARASPRHLSAKLGTSQCGCHGGSSHHGGRHRAIHRLSAVHVDAPGIGSSLRRRAQRVLGCAELPSSLGGPLTDLRRTLSPLRSDRGREMRSTHRRPPRCAVALATSSTIMGRSFLPPAPKI